MNKEHYNTHAQLVSMRNDFEEVIKKHYPPAENATEETHVFLYRLVVKDGKIIKILRNCITEYEAAKMNLDSL